jgi:parallel beta-helix repeat protein
MPVWIGERDVQEQLLMYRSEYAPGMSLYRSRRQLLGSFLIRLSQPGALGTLAVMGGRWIPLLLGAALLVSSCSSSGQEGPSRSPDSTAAEATWSRVEPDVPASAIRISPGSSIQEAVDAAEEGSVFLLESGVHRLQQIEPRSGDTFIGEQGAVVSGAKLLEDFRHEGDLWVHKGLTFSGEERGRCRSEYPACQLPEDLFVDDELIQRVLTLEEVNEDTWFFDSGSGELWVGRDLSGGTVEVSVLPFAFGSDASGVTLDSLVVEKYASPAQRGALIPGAGWTIVNTEVRFNHGQGIRLARDLTISGSYLHHNGQFGVAGGGVGVKVIDNEISHNGTAGFNPFWAAGGTKFLHVTDLVLRGNFVHSNMGAGLWTDGGADGTTYEDNRVVNNEHAGIKHEISGSAIINGNYVEGNGFGNDVDLRGAGILVRESGPVTITGNTVVANRDAIVLLHQDDRNNPTPNRLTGVVVTDNDIAFDGGRIGYIGDVSEDDLGDDIVFEGNRYFGEENQRVFVVRRRSLNFASWKETAHDVGSVMEPRDSFPDS